MVFQEKADNYYSSIEQNKIDDKFGKGDNFSIDELNNYFENDDNKNFIKKDIVSFNNQKFNDSFYKKTIVGKYGITVDKIQYRINNLCKNISDDLKSKGISNSTFDNIFNINSDGIIGKNTIKSIVVFQKILGMKSDGIIDMYLIGFLFPDKFGTNKKLYPEGIDIGLNIEKSEKNINRYIENKLTLFLKNNNANELNKDINKNKENILFESKNKKENIQNNIENPEILNQKIETTNKISNIISKKTPKEKIESKNNNIIYNDFFIKNSETYSGINYKNVINNLIDYGFDIPKYNGESFREDVFNSIAKLQKSFNLPITGIVDYKTISLIFPRYFRTYNKNKYNKYSYEMSEYIKYKVGNIGKEKKEIKEYKDDLFITSSPYEKSKKGTPLCSKTARLNLAELGVKKPKRGTSAKKSFEMYNKEPSIFPPSDLKEGKIADLYLDASSKNRKYGHRVACFNVDGKWYVLDPYYKVVGNKRTDQPIEASTYLSVMQIRYGRKIWGAFYHKKES